MTTLRLIERVSKPTRGGNCLMCGCSIDDCNRYSTQCLGHVCRAAKNAGQGALFQLESQIDDFVAIAGLYP